MQALNQGVPVVCVPFCCDQYDIAVRVVRRGVGACMSRRASAGEFEAGLRSMLADHGSLEAARQLASAMTRENAATVAANELLELVEGERALTDTTASPAEGSADL